jgi:hypothetical protein
MSTVTQYAARHPEPRGCQGIAAFGAQTTAIFVIDAGEQFAGERVQLLRW